MTDNEIIKALECCGKNEPCNTCSYDKNGTNDEFVCCSKLMFDALDLINLQKAEIENLNKDLADTIALNHEERKVLKAEVERLEKCRKEEVEKLVTATDKVICEAKAEAIKEFAERLENKLANNTYISAVGYEAVVFDMQKLVKEMVGDA